MHCQLFYFHDSLARKTPFGSAMFQAISLRPLTPETVVRNQAVLCEICGGDSGRGTGLFEHFGILLSVSFFQ